MTDEEIKASINKVEGIQGMTVNERLYSTGLMSEFEKSKYNNPQKAKFILEQLDVDKSSIDKILTFPAKKRFATLLLLTTVNVGLTVLLVSVLGDNLMNYNRAFWCTTPVILGLIILFGKTIYGLLFKRQYESRATLFYLTLVISIVDILVLILNIYCWVDLFDGMTTVMFP